MEELEQLTKLWLAKIKLAVDRKYAEFGAAANECMAFYDGPYDFLWGPSQSMYSRGFEIVSGQISPPTIKMNVNKPAEMVQLFQPVLYHRNPVRNVSPRLCQVDPMLQWDLLDDQQREQVKMFQMQTGMELAELLRPHGERQRVAQAQLKSRLLAHISNQLPEQNGLKQQSREALLEGLLKGRGLLWIEMREGPKGWLPVSTYESVDNLQLDPDSERLENCQWCARRRRRPVRDVEKQYGLAEGYLKGQMRSWAEQSHELVDERQQAAQKRERTYDVLEYWEVYSRIGLGGNLRGASEELKDALRSWGDNVFLILAEGIPFPINLPPEMVGPGNPSRAADFEQRIAWPISFFENKTHPWPFAPLDFHRVPRRLWPKAHMSFAMGELKAMQWIMSFVVTKVCKVCRDILVMDTSIEEQWEEQILNGPDLARIKANLQTGRGVSDLAQFLQFPDIKSTVWEVYQAVERLFEKRTGLNELLYGQTGSRQMRSAKEAELREQAVNVRPADMANTVEDWMSLAAKLETIALRQHCGLADVAPLFGETYQESQPIQPVAGLPSMMPPPQMGYYTQLYQQLLGSATLPDIVSDFEFTIEAGSARKLNKSAEIDKVQELFQVAFQPELQLYMQSGDPRQINFLLKRYYEANDWQVVDDGLFPDLRQQQAQQQMQMMMQQQQQQAQAANGAPPGQGSPPPEQPPPQQPPPQQPMGMAA